jgi:hypothetical protein
MSRAELLERYRALPMPTTTDESWRFTDLKGVPILARAGILDITAVSKSDLILGGETNPLAIRINSSNGFDAGIIAKYVAETLKAKKVAFLTQNDVYGNGFQTAVEAEFKKALELDPSARVSLLALQIPLRPLGGP